MKEIQDANASNEKKNKKYLYWEPEGFFERVASFRQNLIEMIYVMFVGLATLKFPSFLAAGYFIVSYFFMFAMLNKMETRVLYSQVVLTIKAVLVVSCTIWKIEVYNVNLKHNYTPSQSKFISDIKFYEFLGFDLDYDRSLLTKAHANATSFRFEYNLVFSFILEAFMLVMIISFFMYLRNLNRKIRFL